jgi:hypothetical protein
VTGNAFEAPTVLSDHQHAINCPGRGTASAKQGLDPGIGVKGLEVVQGLADGESACSLARRSVLGSGREQSKAFFRLADQQPA